MDGTFSSLLTAYRLATSALLSNACPVTIINPGTVHLCFSFSTSSNSNLPILSTLQLTNTQNFLRCIAPLNNSYLSKLLIFSAFFSSNITLSARSFANLWENSDARHLSHRQLYNCLYIPFPHRQCGILISLYLIFNGQDAAAFGFASTRLLFTVCRALPLATDVLTSTGLCSTAQNCTAAPMQAPSPAHSCTFGELPCRPSAAFPGLPGHRTKRLLHCLTNHWPRNARGRGCKPVSHTQMGRTCAMLVALPTQLTCSIAYTAGPGFQTAMPNQALTMRGTACRARYATWAEVRPACP